MTAYGRAHGYYVYEHEAGDESYYYMGTDPPKDQYLLVNGAWEPLTDGWYLMDMIIGGNVNLSSPSPTRKTASRP